MQEISCFGVRPEHLWPGACSALGAMIARRLLRRHAAALAAAFAAVAAPVLAAPVPALQVLEEKSKLCTAPIADAERRHNIPGHLMTAVAVAESGRWSPEARATFAWPWTVTSGNRSWRPATKAEAVALVRRLRAEGVTNIDVGCMQVNLGWHPDAFPSLEAAFDPETNVAYAAALLAHHFEVRRSWSLAVGHYHSATPELRDRYRRKVMTLWNGVRRAAAEARRQELIARHEAARAARLAQR